MAGVPLVVTTLLGLTWHYRKADLSGLRPTNTSFLQQILSLTSKLSPSEGQHYLMKYMLLHDLGLYICLNICFALGVAYLNAYHLPFTVLASFIMIFPQTGPYLWIVVVFYLQFFILFQYWRHYM